MRFLFFILIPYLSFAQIKVNDFVIPDDAMHFYGAVAIAETAHCTQTLLFKDQDPFWKFFNSWLITQAAIFGKEIFDKYKRNPTGFNLIGDVPPGELGVHTWLMVKISINDFKQCGFVPRKKKNKYYLSRE
jgi:hypothetical protein